MPSSTSGWKAADIEADRKWKGKSFSKLKDLEEGEKPKEVDSDEWVTSDEIKRRSKAVGTIKRGGEDEGIAVRLFEVIRDFSRSRKGRPT